MQNAFATFDTSNPRIVRVTYHPQEPTNAELDEFIVFASRALNDNRDFVLVSDVSKLKYLSLEHRFKIVSWIKSNQALIMERCLGSVYLVSSIFGRMILNGIFLIVKPVIPRVTVSSMAEAEKWAEERISKSKNTVKDTEVEC